MVNRLTTMFGKSCPSEIPVRELPDLVKDSLKFCHIWEPVICIIKVEAQLEISTCPLLIAPEILIITSMVAIICPQNLQKAQLNFLVQKELKHRVDSTDRPLGQVLEVSHKEEVQFTPHPPPMPNQASMKLTSVCLRVKRTESNSRTYKESMEEELSRAKSFPS